MVKQLPIQLRFPFPLRLKITFSSASHTVKECFEQFYILGGTVQYSDFIAHVYFFIFS